METARRKFGTACSALVTAAVLACGPLVATAPIAFAQEKQEERTAAPTAPQTPDDAEAAAAFGQPTRHGAFIFECTDSGFNPPKITTDKGKATLIILNSSSYNQTYAIIRKRAGKKRTLFQGSTIPQQSISGDTSFKAGDVFYVKETVRGREARVVIKDGAPPPQ